LGTGVSDRYKKIVFRQEAVDELLVAVFIESHRQAPTEIVLDMDTTDLPLHGKQEGRFFHGYYDSYCYLPLCVFCGDHVLCVRLREANHDAAYGCRPEIERIVKQIRAAWPEVKIVLRGDSGFCRNQLMSWCETNHVDYIFGMARNQSQRLRRIIGRQMQEATVQWKQTGKPARGRSPVLHPQNRSSNAGTYRRWAPDTSCRFVCCGTACRSNRVPLPRKCRQAPDGLPVSPAVPVRDPLSGCSVCE
jgi:hypothetical protein